MKPGRILAGAAAGAAAAAAGAMLLVNRRFVRNAEAAVPADGQMVELAGDRIHYTDEGQGPAILMIHGLGGQMRNFGRPMVEDLVRDHRVIRAAERPSISGIAMSIRMRSGA